MWPKVFAQLVELLPHISRLVPMAEKFFASKKANEASLTAMTEGVRGDLTLMAATHADLFHQLQEQSAGMAADARLLRAAIERDALRLETLERRTAALAVWTRAGVLLLVVVLGLLIVLLVRAR